MQIASGRPTERIGNAKRAWHRRSEHRGVGVRQSLRCLHIVPDRLDHSGPPYGQLCWCHGEIHLSTLRRAVVLGGGGFKASAWEIGVMAGLAETGLDLRSDDSFLGTSAGARVALHLASGSDLDQLFEQQSKPVLGAPASSPSVDWPRIQREWTRAREAGGGPAAILRRVGSLALEVAVARVEDRRSIVASQLPVQTWPERSLAMVAVNVESGERRAFDRHSGVELVDAVMATTPSGVRLPYCSKATTTSTAGSTQATTLISQPASTK
jgi:hypothetical protein